MPDRSEFLRMTDAEMRERMEAIGLTLDELAALSGRNYRGLNAAVTGQRPTDKFLAEFVRRYNEPMDADEMRVCLSLIGWSQNELADFAERNADSIRKMCSRKHEIDLPLANWLRVARLISPAIRTVRRLLDNPPSKPTEERSAA